MILNKCNSNCLFTYATASKDTFIYVFYSAKSTGVNTSIYSASLWPIMPLIWAPILAEARLWPAVHPPFSCQALPWMLCDTRVSVRDMHNLSIGTGVCYRPQEGTEQIALLDLTTWGSGLETLTPAAAQFS